eukprot:EG_transcript_29166
MKMMFKKHPGLQLPAPGAGDSHDGSVKREHEPDTDRCEPPLKKFGALGLHTTTVTPPTPGSIGVVGNDDVSDEFDQQEPEISTSSNQMLPVDIEQLKTKVQELETELFYVRGDLQHEQARWTHFRRRAQKHNIWGVLMGVADVLDAEPQPLRSAAHSEAMLDVELQLDQVQEALAEETARAEGLVRETERLARENEQLQR